MKTNFVIPETILANEKQINPDKKGNQMKKKLIIPQTTLAANDDEARRREILEKMRNREDLIMSNDGTGRILSDNESGSIKGKKGSIKVPKSILALENRLCVDEKGNQMKKKLTIPQTTLAANEDETIRGKILEKIRNHGSVFISNDGTGRIVAEKEIDPSTGEKGSVKVPDTILAFENRLNLDKKGSQMKKKLIIPQTKLAAADDEARRREILEKMRNREDLVMSNDGTGRILSDNESVSSNGKKGSVKVPKSILA